MENCETENSYHLLEETWKKDSGGCVPGGEAEVEHDQSEVDFEEIHGGQNEYETASVAKLLDQFVHYHQLSQLPINEPPKFSCDIVEYRWFKIAFKSTIEEKCASFRDKFYYLLKYTEGDANDLIKSCLELTRKNLIV